MVNNELSAVHEPDRTDSGDCGAEIEFVIARIAEVLSSAPSRELLYFLAEDVDAGNDLGRDFDWDHTTQEDIHRLVRIAVSSSLLRAVVLIINADKQVSDLELQFARTVMNPLIAVIRESGASQQCPRKISSREDFFTFSAWLRERSKVLFEDDGLGGGSTSIPRLCSMCDPFVESPLLPVYLFAVHRLCSKAAAVDGVGSEEQAVLQSFSRLVDRCEEISKRVAERLPVVTDARSSLDEKSSLEDLERELHSFGAKSRQNVRFLSFGRRRSRRLRSRLARNRVRKSRWLFDSLNGSSLFLLCATWVLVFGVGFVIASACASIAIGGSLIVVGGYAATRVVVERLLNLSWYSTSRMENELKALRFKEYSAWKELSKLEDETKRLQPIAHQKAIVAEERRRAAALAEEARLRAERERRLAALYSYLPSTGGPITVRSYFRKDGTFVRSHTRRRS